MNNAKEILKMLVTMSGYMTNTISMCQELAASNTAVRLSSASTGSKKYVNLISYLNFLYIIYTSVLQTIL